MYVRFMIIIFLLGFGSIIDASTSLEVMKSEKRFAFVIGNAQYEFGNITKSTRSARNMRDFLQKKNFKVTYLENANKTDIVKAYRKFINMINRSDIALIYFSGYVVGKDKINYLIPVESQLENNNQLRERGIDLDFLITKTNGTSPRMSMIILDAYRLSGLKGINGKSSKIESMGHYKLIDSYSTFSKKTGKNNGKFTSDFIGVFNTKGLSNMQGANKLSAYTTHNANEVFYFSIPEMLEQDYDIAWKQVKEEDSLLAYQAFLLTYPKSPHAKKASELLSTRQAESGRYIDKRVDTKNNTDFQKEIDRLKKEQAELLRLQEEAKRRSDLEMKQRAKRSKAESDEIKRLKAENAKILAEQQLSKTVKSETLAAKAVDYIEPDLAVIQAGTFLMGSGTLKESSPVHQVNIRHAFKIAKYEVTNREYVLFLKDTGKKYRKKKLLKELDTPVTYVSWKHAMEYVEWLSKVSGKKYRLPTEAEWEYAARAGSPATFAWGENAVLAPQYAWMKKNSYGFVRTHGLLKPNTFDIYDMFGNVAEWCLDDYSDGYKNAPTDGSAHVQEDAMKVVRGGSWKSPVDELKTAYRNSNIPTFKNDATGFRIVLDD